MKSSYPDQREPWRTKGEEKNRGHWKLEIIEELFLARNGVVRGARLRAGKSYLERPIQHLYPLEFSCNKTSDAPNVDTTLNPEAPEIRFSRDAAVAAMVRIQEQAEDELVYLVSFIVFIIGNDLVTSLC